jgi:2-polyprenyl-6-hydroxyphenyl methylase/3-demethylubiquinone-9 3-methyltransferase
MKRTTRREDTMFAFGRNWQRFSHLLDDNRIAASERYLSAMLQRERLDGLHFLDIGSGSGLSSLAAWRLGAHVLSFDYDADSVACTAELRRRHCPDGIRWTVEQGSALDVAYLRSLGSFDVVHAWGVLHHTGAMWQALDNALIPLAPGGRLVVAIYNDEGLRSRVWTRIKRLYNTLPRPLRIPYATVVIAGFEGQAALRALLTLRPHHYVRSWIGYERTRGMSPLYDWIDWIGGYPFEVARPEGIFEFYRRRGLTLLELRTTAGLGCNEFVFAAPARPVPASERTPMPGVPTPEALAPL